MINTKYLLCISTCLLFSDNIQASDINLTYDSSDTFPRSFSLHTLHTPNELKPAPFFNLDNAVKLASVCSVNGGGSCGDLVFNSMDLDTNLQCEDEHYTKTCDEGFVPDTNQKCPYNPSYFKCRPAQNTCESGYSLTACSSTQVQTASYTNEAKNTCYQCRDKTCAESGYQSSITSCQKGTPVSLGGQNCYMNVTNKTCEDGGYQSSIPTNNKCDSTTYCSKTCYSNCRPYTCEDGGYVSACPTNQIGEDITYQGKTCKTKCAQPSCDKGGFLKDIPTNNKCTPVSYFGTKCFRDCYQPTCDNGGYLAACPANQTGTPVTYYGRTCYKKGTCKSTEKTCEEGNLKSSITSCQKGTAVPYEGKTCYQNVTDKTCEDGGYKSSCPSNQVGTSVSFCNKTCYKDCKPTDDPTDGNCEKGGYFSKQPSGQVCTFVAYEGQTCYNCREPEEICSDEWFDGNQCCTYNQNYSDFNHYLGKVYILSGSLCSQDKSFSSCSQVISNESACPFKDSAKVTTLPHENSNNETDNKNNLIKDFLDICKLTDGSNANIIFNTSIWDTQDVNGNFYHTRTTSLDCPGKRNLSLFYTEKNKKIQVVSFTMPQGWNNLTNVNIDATKKVVLYNTTLNQSTITAPEVYIYGNLRMANSRINADRIYISSKTSIIAGLQPGTITKDTSTTNMYNCSAPFVSSKSSFSAIGTSKRPAAFFINPDDKECFDDANKGCFDEEPFSYGAIINNVGTLEINGYNGEDRPIFSEAVTGSQYVDTSHSICSPETNTIKINDFFGRARSNLFYKFHTSEGNTAPMCDKGELTYYNNIYNIESTQKFAQEIKKNTYYFEINDQCSIPETEDTTDKYYTSSSVAPIEYNESCTNIGLLDKDFGIENEIGNIILFVGGNRGSVEIPTSNGSSQTCYAVQYLDSKSYSCGADIVDSSTHLDNLIKSVENGATDERMIDKYIQQNHSLFEKLRDIYPHLPYYMYRNKMLVYGEKTYFDYMPGIKCIMTEATSMSDKEACKKIGTDLNGNYYPIASLPLDYGRTFVICADASKETQNK